MPIWTRGKQEHWKEVPPPEGWDSRWPAIFVINAKTVWGEDEQGDVNLSVETHLHGVCNGPRIAEMLRHHAQTPEPTLWALVPVGRLDYSHLEGEGQVIQAIAEGQRELPSGPPTLRVIEGGKS